MSEPDSTDSDTLYLNEEHGVCVADHATISYNFVAGPLDIVSIIYRRAGWCYKTRKKSFQTSLIAPISGRSFIEFPRSCTRKEFLKRVKALFYALLCTQIQFVSLDVAIQAPKRFPFRRPSTRSVSRAVNMAPKWLYLISSARVTSHIIRVTSLIVRIHFEPRESR